MNKRIKVKTKFKASFTIEAAVVVPICMVILVSVVLVAFYLHDNVVLKAAAQSLVLESAADFVAESENAWTKESENGSTDDKKTDEYDADVYFSRRLIILKNTTYESSKKDDGVIFSDGGSFSAESGMAATILSSLGSQNEKIEITHLLPRKKLVKYKILCDGAEKIGLVDK